MSMHWVSSWKQICVCVWTQLQVVTSLLFSCQGADIQSNVAKIKFSKKEYLATDKNMMGLQVDGATRYQQ